MTFCLMWQWTITFCIVRLMPVLLTAISSRTYFVVSCHLVPACTSFLTKVNGSLALSS